MRGGIERYLCIVVLMSVVFWGCAQKQSEMRASSPKPETAVESKSAAIAQLINQPKTYAGKEVAVQGVFSGVCCATDFFLKDGVDIIEVYTTPMCPMPSKSKTQSKLTVLGTVLVRGDQVAIVAKELIFE